LFPKEEPLFISLDYNTTGTIKSQALFSKNKIIFRMI